MGTSLIEAASSAYISARNALKGVAIPDVFVYVEGDDDIAFWQELTMLYSNKYKFYITQLRDTSSNKILPGKSKLLECISLNTLGANKVIAVDADFDWIIDEYKTSTTSESYSEEIRNNQYILHTYLHSIENYKCHSQCIPAILRKCTCIPISLKDCLTYISEISSIIAPLFLIHLVSLHNCDGVYTIAMFTADMSQFSTKIVDIDKLDSARIYIENKVAKLMGYAISNHNLIYQYKLKLKSLNFTAENYYLLCRGHDIQNTLVKNILMRVIYKKRKDVIAKLKSQPNGSALVNLYASITGIKGNSHKALSYRIDQLLSDCSNIKLAAEGYNRVKYDLARIFG
jgi:hypothetical protein